LALALLFDLDGTLMDTLEAIVVAMNSASDEMGVSPHFRDAELRPMIGMPVQRQLEELRGVTGPLADAFTDAYYTHFARAVDRGLRLYPGVAETLTSLAGRAVTTMSTRRRSQAERMLRVVGLRSFFREVVGGDQVARPKPNPDLPLLGARALGVPPNLCVAIGDSSVDILAGRAAGMKSVAVMYGYGSPTAIIKARPDATVEKFFDLPLILEALEP